MLHGQVPIMHLNLFDVLPSIFLLGPEGVGLGLGRARGSRPLSAPSSLLGGRAGWAAHVLSQLGLT